ncbi:hypothetical protein LEP1GSC016_0255 [Leptospira borgpetersenii serovar Hardjo-bovis str. Sponselee]|uniref:Lipoprotein n=1 Tax=Leptospira borgpetersenii serovar Hardjo-bovis str. Sponselee TaxID=1303729 RepID=M6C857_LEPBO|nr:Hypothetical protein LBL_2672 [Leptospira borgpetersenii serovar Hardjo-bovis str. L550]AMX59454.1 hypothetical protein LBK6_14335 [Leptospira borgpetersenii serovar Hardjo]EMJ84948.1 hypothetical protein LEP1GSC016_0255 [Leptospira borgpetersenii serovar Hardjo-bovis str. Sponselee]AMX62682.1 hypothetical protein LBK9_14255 [Leptospira borgpetersenii serovar Hardjo]AMX65925.1 hypothetical protein LBK30_14265 [Leptospira borgpetersenii serovar Hardjo]
MKKYFITFLIPFFSITNCYLFDKVGLSTPDTVSGKDAKNQILTSALIGAVSSPDDTAIIAIISPQLAKIDENRYYKKKRRRQLRKFRFDHQSCHSEYRRFYL